MNRLFGSWRLRERESGLAKSAQEGFDTQTMKPKANVTFQLRFRILCGKEIAMGPGKADLLQQVAAHGSISKAAKHLGMSYMRAWTLIKTMERCFRDPLVKVSRGGAEHGGAQLTARGRQILNLYRKMEKDSLGATTAIRNSIAKLVRS